MAILDEDEELSSTKNGEILLKNGGKIMVPLCQYDADCTTDAETYINNEIKELLNAHVSYQIKYNKQ